MGKLTVDTGTLGNPATGDSLRTAFNKVNTNFDEIYEVVGDPDTGLLTTAVTNGDIKVQPKAGRMLMFPPNWTYKHKANKPINQPKYILGSYLHYA